MTTTTATTTKKPVTETAMLLKVTIHQWTARKEDKKITSQVAAHNNANVNRFKTRKDLIDRSFFEDMTAINSQIRTVWREKTLPWLDDGVRILPSAFYFDVMRDLKALIHARETVVFQFLANYDNMREEAKQALNGAFNERDYPPAGKLQRSFDVDLITFPIPTGGDFHVPLDDDTAAEIKANVDSQVETLIANAMREPWQRVHDTVSHMSDKLRSYGKDANGKVVSSFRDSLVENVIELAHLLPGLNIANDDELTAMSTRLEESLCKFHPDELRHSSRARNEVADEADKILADVSDFLA